MSLRTVLLGFVGVVQENDGRPAEEPLLLHRKLFVADMQRIFSNCRHYNEADTEYVKCANALEKYFILKMKDAGLWDK